MISSKVTILVTGSLHHCVDATGKVNYSEAQNKAWPKLDKFLTKIMKLEDLEDKRDIVFVEGGSKGAEAVCRAYATHHEMMCLTVPAQWRRLGKAAYKKQMKELLKTIKVNYVLAFWDRESGATRDILRHAARYEIPTKVFKIGEVR